MKLHTKILVLCSLYFFNRFQVNSKVPDQTLILGEDGEAYRWFLLPSEAAIYLSGMKPATKNFKMPFFPRKSVSESKIKSRTPSKSCYNPHVCATCRGCNASIWNESKTTDSDSNTGEQTIQCFPCRLA